VGLSLIHASVLGFGTAAASGTVQFYAVGTLTPVITFSDDAGTQPLSGALALGATGAPATAVYTATPLRAIVKSSSGATLQDISRIDGDRAELVQVSNSAFTGTDLNTILTAIQSSTGGIDAQFFGTYSSVATSLKQEIEGIGLTPQRFGAKGNGVSDDTAAFLLLAAAQTSSGLPVFLPKGTYKISSVITFSNALVMSGVGASLSPVGSVIQQSSATAGGLSLASNNLLTNFCLTAVAGSSGAGLSLGAGSKLVNVGVFSSGGGFATAATGAGDLYVTQGSSLIGTSVGLGGIGRWNLDSSSSFSGTSTTGNTIFAGATSYNTADVANAGSLTPLFDLSNSEQYYRVRGTSAAGTGTINAPNNFPTNRACRLVFDLQATGGGTFQFNFNAIFHGTAANTGAITSAQRQVWVWMYDPIGATWIEQSHTASYAI
jgi:hypothetical protein